MDTPGDYTYEIDWNGDGQVDERIDGPGSGMEVTHLYDAEGKATVLARAYPRLGGNPGVDLHTVQTEILASRDDAVWIGGTTEANDIIVEQLAASQDCGSSSTGSHPPFRSPFASLSSVGRVTIKSRWRPMWTRRSMPIPETM